MVNNVTFKVLSYPLTPGILALIGMRLKELATKGCIEIDIRGSKKLEYALLGKVARFGLKFLHSF